MSFDASKSKLFPQIMESVARFFGLSSDATETEIHAAVEGQNPLAVQLEEARNAAESKNGTDITEMKEQLAQLQTAQEKTAAELSLKDERIAELQTQIATNETAIEQAGQKFDAMKLQFEKENRVLAGQVSSLKAGRPLEQDEQGDAHAADQKNEGEPKVLAIQSNKLKESLTRQRQN